MKMNFKKTLSLILAVLMVMTAVPLSGMATDATTCDHANAEIDVISKTADGKFRHYITCSCGLDEKQFCDGPDATSCGEAKKCSICNQVIGAALEHSYARGAENADTIKETGADCRVANTYFETCTACGDVSDTRFFTSETNFGPHDWDEGTKTYEDCEEAGTCTYKCEIEGCEAELTEEVEAIGHDFTAKVEDDEYLVAGSVATCEKGLDYYYSCVNCGAKGTEKFTSDVTGGHTFIPVKNQDHWIPETCTQDAVYYNYCTSCLKYADELEGCENEKVTDVGSAHGKPTSKDEVRRPLTEDEIVVISHADCLDNAKYSLHCKKCGEPMIEKKEAYAKEDLHFYEVEGTALNPGHRDLTKLELVAERIEPTCTTKGQEAIYRCPKGEDCPNWKESKEIGGDVIDPKDHSFDSDKATDYEMSDSCTGGGKYARKYCTACETSFFYDANGKEVDKMSGLKEKTIDGKRHVNNNSDDLCDVCGYVVTPEETCTCICHKSGFMYIVALFLKLFWKFTGAKPYCNCGKAHY